MGKKSWYDNFNESQRNQITFARIYSANFQYDTPGYINMFIIAKMADLLDEATTKGRANAARPISNEELAAALGNG